MVEYPTRESGDMAEWSHTALMVSPAKAKDRGEWWRVVAETYEMGRVLRDYPSNGDTLPYPREEGNGRVLRHRSHGLSCKGKSWWRAKGEGSGC